MDLRKPLLHDLYRFRVDAARLGAALPAVDQQLSVLCQSAWTELHAPLAGALLEALAQALAHVLLHGGPHRCSIVVWSTHLPCMLLLFVPAPL